MICALGLLSNAGPRPRLARGRARSRQEEGPALPLRWRRRGWGFGRRGRITRIVHLPGRWSGAGGGPGDVCGQSRAGHDRSAGEQSAHNDPTQCAVDVHASEPLSHYSRDRTSQIVRRARCENMGRLTYLVPGPARRPAMCDTRGDSRPLKLLRLPPRDRTPPRRREAVPLPEERMRRHCRQIPRRFRHRSHPRPRRRHRWKAGLRRG